MNENSELIKVANLLLEIATTLMGAGSHTSRVVKNTTRMAQSFGYEVFLTNTQKSMTMMVRKEGQVESITLVRSIKHLAINFNIVAELSSLSWHIHDENITIDQAREHYEEIMAKPRISKWAVVILVALANASFCRLFKGDFTSCGLVLVSTFIAFSLRQQLLAHKFNLPLTFVLSAMTSSMIAGLGYMLNLGATPDIAVATSVLFLIPGVPLINSLMDILEGHILNGIARFVNATILIISIAIGFLATMLILGLENI